MDQYPLPMSYQASPLGTPGRETQATSQAQPSEQATAGSGTSPQIFSRNSVGKTSRPSCNLCRRRKKKCDRADPCSHCLRAGSQCVTLAPSGAPRGRQGGRRRQLDSELLLRVEKLEHLLKDIEDTNTEIPSMSTVANGNLTV